jgi:hypothetical protein
MHPTAPPPNRAASRLAAITQDRHATAPQRRTDVAAPPMRAAATGTRGASHDTAPAPQRGHRAAARIDREDPGGLARRRPRPRSTARAAMTAVRAPAADGAARPAPPA